MYATLNRENSKDEANQANDHSYKYTNVTKNK